MVDKEFCMSSYLTFRYIIDDTKDFFEGMNHQIYKLIPDEKRILVDSAHDVDKELRRQFDDIRGQKQGLLLSGGMDSACLATYMRGCDAYTFRFLNGKFQRDEIERAELFAKRNDMKLHYVDIEWKTVENHLYDAMKQKNAPVHSIEPQVLQAALQAKEDGIDRMIIGDAADYVFGGMDGLYAKDWKYDEFKRRITYIDPNDVLVNPVDLDYAFDKFRRGDEIDFISLMHEYVDIESYSSYANAFNAANVEYLDPYEILKMGGMVNLHRIRNGESKYIIRELFAMKYPDIPIPDKNPMPRPVDIYFESWGGPHRSEFIPNLDMHRFSGNQKWLLFCLEKFLEYFDKNSN